MPAASKLRFPARDPIFGASKWSEIRITLHRATGWVSEGGDARCAHLPRLRFSCFTFRTLRTRAC